MTTENTHYEHNDADASVVQSPPASEATVDSNASAFATPSVPEETSASPAPEASITVDSVSSADPESAVAADSLVLAAQPAEKEPTSDSEQSQPETLAEQQEVTVPATPVIISSAIDAAAEDTTEETARAEKPHIAEEPQENILVAQEIVSESVQDTPVEGIPAANQDVNATELHAEVPTEEQVSSPAEQPAEPGVAEAVSLLQVASETQEGSATAAEASEVVAEEPKTAESASFPYAGILSFAEPKVEDTRSFDDFFEEFRQAEASQSGSLVDFSTLAPEGTDLNVPSEIFIASKVAHATPEVPEEMTAPAAAADATGITQETLAEATSETAPVVLPDSVQHTHASKEEQAAEAEAAQELSAPTQTPARVSPLLRPASRLRTPRHSSRHHREEPAPEAASAPQPEQPAEKVEPEKPVEQPAEPVVEQPKPARRYRFDRPANRTSKTESATSVSQSGTVHTTAQPRQEESRDKEPAASTSFSVAPRSETSAPEPVESAPKSAPNGGNGHATEVQQSSAKHAAKEQAPVESTNVGVSESTDTSRRRPHQERQQKEQPVASHSATSSAHVAETVTPTPEPPQVEPIAPEDLPPLEYAELQKATSTRRRRRHRNGTTTNNGAVAAPSPVAPPEAPAVPVILPPPPAPPAALSAPSPQAVTRVRQPLPPVNPQTDTQVNPYSIVSGYTVSQMNQGNEVAGPFMGPEPSPARGSVVTRDGRTPRADTQRTSYPPISRANHEGSPSASSLNHLANVVSQSIQQSIQLQTDRMVAELRRSNQGPTSVSVSLPPFPSTERVGVFVDVANLLYSARTLRIAVDFGKLLDFLRGNRRLVRAHAYCPTSPQAGDEQMFLQAVKGLGYRITTKNYKTFSSGSKKADLDLDLCMDVVRLVDGRSVDCIVLVSGDSDFMPMLDYCSDHGVRVEVAAFDEAMSATLRQSCDLFINLSMLEEIRS